MAVISKCIRESSKGRYVQGCIEVSPSADSWAIVVGAERGHSVVGGQRI